MYCARCGQKIEERAFKNNCLASIRVEELELTEFDKERLKQASAIVNSVLASACMRNITQIALKLPADADFSEAIHDFDVPTFTHRFTFSSREAPPRFEGEPLKVYGVQP